MTNAVKCISCNIVIDEMLSYIQNKLSVIDEDTLVRICTSSFGTDDIEKSKALLFESVPVDKPKIKRKNKGKEQRDLGDIINVFKSTEPDLFPTFVARDLERLPPILFDHLDCTKLLKDLLKVQNELKEVKESYVTQMQLSELKKEILKYQNDSLVSSSAMDSSPMGLANATIDEINIRGRQSSPHELVDINSVPTLKNMALNLPQQAGGGSSVHQTAATSITTALSANAPLRPAVVTSPARPATLPPSSRQSAVRQSAICNNNVTTGGPRPGGQNLPDSELAPVCVDVDEGWQKVSHRKKPLKYRYLGSTGISRDNEGRFKAAVKKVPMFITKVHKDTSDADIIDYVYNKTQEKIILESILFKHDRDYKAYKFFVSNNKLSLFLDDKLWPEGIIFRRFINFKARSFTLNGANNGPVNDR